MIRISVVVPAYNEEECIGECLESLCRQSTRSSMEVIVVDNNSTDRTAEIALSFRGRLEIRVMRERRKGRGGARSTGFAAARGKIILSTDADTVVPPGWVESYERHFAMYPDVDAIGGVSRIEDCSPLTNAVYNVGHPCMLAGFRFLYGHDWLSGFNFGIRAHSYGAAGGFDPVTDCLEDYDLSRRVARIGRTTIIRSIRVRVSGRRYRKGIIAGIAPYLVSIVERGLLRRQRCLLSDIR